MATLETIRKRAGILVMGAIGLAMLGFILGDFNIQPNRTVAEINGKTYSIEDYQQEQKVLLDFYKMNYGQNLDPEIERQVEHEAWRRMVRNSVMDRSYDKIGLAVSDDELKAMVAGDPSSGIGSGSYVAFSEPHPIIRQMFTNPETGEFNRAFMMTYFNSLDREEYAQERQRWLFIENEIVEERLNQKYLALVVKGLRPSSLEVLDYHMETDKKVDFSFVAQGFSSIPDEEVQVSEADIKAYYQENIENYMTEESRSIQYVSFEVVPSEEDDANAMLWTQHTKEEFSRTEQENIVSYVNGISDEPFDPQFYTPSELNPIIRDSLLSLPTGKVYGPYFEDNAYKLSLVKDIQLRPDSVRARHILIGYSIVGSMQRAVELADSLKAVIENGGNFSAIAREYSADESNRNIGGDLGWFTEGVMETPFNNAAFENNKGDIVKATTRFGVHILMIEDQSRPVKKYQIATIVHSVYPSNETDQDYYNRAVKFRGKATNIDRFEEQASEYGMNPRIVPDITKDQRTIPGLENPVNIIGWAFSAEKGDVSTIFEAGNQYIVAALTEVKDDGYATPESVREEIEIAVRKQKKGEKIAASMNEGLKETSDIVSFAASQNLELKEATQVEFSNTYVPGIGLEPFIIGAALNLPPETLSGPYIGENAVFVISVTNIDAGDPEASLERAKNRLNITIRSWASQAINEAMIDKADITDNRLRIFYSR